MHFKVRLGESRLCALVIVGVCLDGTKELESISDGERESTESWADVLRDLRRRGMRAPMNAVGDGALGFWAALRQVFPTTGAQRCWVHKAANVLNVLPKSAQPAARQAIAEIRDVEDREHAVKAIEAFKADYGVAGSAGVQLLLVHAKHEHAKSFYQHFGFKESPADPLTMMMLLPKRENAPVVRSV
jgi:putative transposase